MRDALIFAILLFILFPLSVTASGSEKMHVDNTPGEGRACSLVQLSGTGSATPVTRVFAPCYFTRADSVSLDEISSISYSRTDETGKIIWQKFFRVRLEEFEKFTVSLQSQCGTGEEADEDFECHNFYTGEGRDYPACMLVTTTDGEPIEYYTFSATVDDRVSVTAYSLEAKLTSENIYLYDGGRLIENASFSDGKPEWTYRFRYRKGRNGPMQSTELLNSRGRVMSAARLDRRGRVRTNEVYTVRPDGTTEFFSQKTTYRGHGTNFTARTKNHRGKPSFDYSGYTRTENNRPVYTVSNTGYRTEGEETDGKKKKTQTRYIAVEQHYLYNERGDLTVTIDALNGTGYEMTYHYDADGHCYARSSKRIPEDNSPRQVTLSSRIYSDGYE